MAAEVGFPLELLGEAGWLCSLLLSRLPVVFSFRPHLIPTTTFVSLALALPLLRDYCGSTIA